MVLSQAVIAEPQLRVLGLSLEPPNFLWGWQSLGLSPPHITSGGGVAGVSVMGAPFLGTVPP